MLPSPVYDADADAGCWMLDAPPLIQDQVLEAKEQQLFAGLVLVPFWPFFPVTRCLYCHCLRLGRRV